MNASPLLRLLSHAGRHRPRVAAATACSALKKLFDITLWRVQIGEEPGTVQRP